MVLTNTDMLPLQTQRTPTKFKTGHPIKKITLPVVSVNGSSPGLHSEECVKSGVTASLD